MLEMGIPRDSGIAIAENIARLRMSGVDILSPTDIYKTVETSRMHNIADYCANDFIDGSIWSDWVCQAYVASGFKIAQTVFDSISVSQCGFFLMTSKLSDCKS